MRVYLFLCIATTAVNAWDATITLVDSSRVSTFHPKGRRVTAIVCGRDDAPGALPLYVFGHGFDCLAADYQWLCDASSMVTALVVSSDITPFLPDTADMALDQAFLTKALPTAAASASSPLHGRLTDKAAFGGHSMGGGTSVLAANASFAPAASYQALALFAPGLYTRPPAYPSKAAVHAPLLIVSGSDDCGKNALPKEALPLYNDASSKTKALVALKGANHCQWTSASKGVCAAAECHHIERDDQWAAGRRLLDAFMPAALGASAWSDFTSFLAAGEKAGEWRFITMDSPPGANITNDCPCSPPALVS